MQLPISPLEGIKSAAMASTISAKLNILTLSFLLPFKYFSQKLSEISEKIRVCIPMFI